MKCARRHFPIGSTPANANLLSHALEDFFASQPDSHGAPVIYQPGRRLQPTDGSATLILRFRSPNCAGFF
jgi:hypothetical protein